MLVQGVVAGVLRTGQHAGANLLLTVPCVEHNQEDGQFGHLTKHLIAGNQKCHSHCFSCFLSSKVNVCHAVMLSCHVMLNIFHFMSRLKSDDDSLPFLFSCLG